MTRKNNHNYYLVSVPSVPLDKPDITTMDLLNKALNLIDKTDIEGDGGDLDCISDDEDKGSRFQNENVYNKLLPYDVTSESQEHLMRIKASIAKCIELDQETVYEWLIELDR